MPSSTTSNAKVAGPNAPLWIKILVGWHVIAITIWALPNPSQAIVDKKAVPTGSDILLAYNNEHLKSLDFVRGYLYLTGSWQYWDMFSPNPALVDVWFDAVVTYKDGSKRTYAYPRIYDLPIPQKFLKERYRKFYERVNNPSYAYVWTNFGQHIAHLMDDPSNPPVVVQFRRHFYPIPEPGKPKTDQYTIEAYFNYVVDPQKLEQDRQ